MDAGGPATRPGPGPAAALTLPRGASTVGSSMHRSSRRHLFHLAVLLGFCLLGVFFAGFRWVDRHLPSPYRLRDIQPPQKTVVLDINERVVHEFFRENRDVVPLSAIPKPLVEAILATEDRKFYEHWGVDVFGVLRAMT